MTMMRRGSQRSLAPFGDMVNFLMDDPWDTLDRMRQQAVPTLPALDVRETDDAYVVKAEMPGVKPDDAEVTLDGRTLVIRGKYGEERDDEREGRWIVRERRSGTYARAITLPGAIDPDRITTSFEDGELKLTLPKAEESRARRIPIKGGGESAKSVGSGEGRTTGNGSRSGAGEATESRSR